jgi:hypothetical protein
MRHLEGRRLEYDAARRRLEAAADKAATAEAGGARDPAGAERRLGRTEGEVEREWPPHWGCAWRRDVGRKTAILTGWQPH